MSSLKNFASCIKGYLGRGLSYCDVGARGGLYYRWKPVAELLDPIGFEPDPEEFEHLTASGCGHYYNFALYSRDGTVEFHLTHSRECSSAYEPNKEFLCLFPESERFAVEKTLEVPCVTLDALKADGKLGDVDFLKIDVQGAELDVLRGGKNLLADSVLGMEIEVEFVELYKGQPLFAQVDGFITKELGLRIQDLRKYFWKLEGAERLGSPRGQLVFADAIYFRPVEDIAAWCADMDVVEARHKVLCAVVMGAVYGCVDYSMSILRLPEIERWFGAKELARAKNLVEEFGKGLNLYRKGRFLKIAGGFFSLYRLFESAEKPWQAAEPSLGSRKRFGWFE